jgi:hypothetical protein
VRDEPFTSVATVLKLVVGHASFLADVRVYRLIGVSVDCEELEGFAKERLDDEGHCEGVWVLMLRGAWLVLSRSVMR